MSLVGGVLQNPATAPVLGAVGASFGIPPGLTSSFLGSGQPAQPVQAIQQAPAQPVVISQPSGGGGIDSKTMLLLGGGGIVLVVIALIFSRKK